MARWLIALGLALACVPGCRDSEEAAPSASVPPGGTAPQPTDPTQVVLEETVRFAAADGATLVGTLRRTTEPVRGGVLLLHMLGRTRADWADTQVTLAGAGFVSLALDIRGHGESTQGATSPLDHRNFGPADWQAAIEDISTAYQVLVDQGGAPAGQIAAIGASIGANLAINAAAQDEGIVGVALLSPGLDYRGVTTLEATREYAASLRPYLVVAAQDDAAAAEAHAELTGDAIGLRNCDAFPLYEGSAHGTELLAEDADLVDGIVEWLDQWMVEAAPLEE